MSEVTITDEKLLMLDALTYYQEFSDMEKQTDGTYSTVSNFINNCHQYNTCIHEALQDYTDEDLKMDKIVNWLKEDEASKKLVIVYPNSIDDSTSSVCLVNHETAEVYVIYGGNYAEEDYLFYDRDGKIIRTNTWYDNVRGAVQADTNEQKRAMMFYEDAILAARDYLTQEAVFKDNTGNVRDFNAKDSDGKYIENLNITVSGHSAGGNLAQYVTTTYQKYINDQSVAHPERGKYDENNDIDRCVTFDNQGFSANFINKYNTEISDRAGKITEYIPTVSYVGSLMYDLDGIEKKYIDVGTPEPYLIGYHMPAQMLDARGEFKREGKPDIIYYMMKRLSTKVMDSVSGDSSINIDEAASVMVEAIFEFMKAKNMQEGVEKAIDIISENKAASKISELIIYETIVVLEIDATYYVMVDKKNNVEEIVNLIQEGSMKDALKKSAKSLYQITLERLAQQALLPVMGSDNLGYVLGEFIFDWGAEICSNAADKIEDIVAKCGKAVDQFFDDLFSDDEEVIRLFPIYKGTEQNDTITTGKIGGLIIGDTGDDTLTGSSKADTYSFRPGDGHDVINNHDQVNWSKDVILFSGNIKQEEIEVTRDAYDMVFTNLVTGDSITVKNAYTDMDGWNYIGKVIFWNNGSEWGLEELREKTRVIRGTVRKDIIRGNEWGFNYDQSEVISTYGGDDTIYAGNGDDVIDAGAGDDIVQGEAGNDTITGGYGNDSLMGGSGADTYIIGLGEGQDIINNYDQENWSLDKIVFEDGIFPEDIQVTRSGANMVLSNEKTGDSVTVQNAYNDSRGWNYLGRIVFEDGTIWGMKELKEKTKVLNGTEEDDVIEGNPWGYNYDQSELISTYEGNDIIRAGVGDDVIDAGEGDDTVQGDAGHDDIIGGKGNDYLVGGTGADTYVFGTGDGQDIINNYDQERWLQDKIVFEEGILPEDIRVTRSGANMVLSNEKTGDSVTVQNAYNDSRGWNYLGKIQFSDGTMWKMDDLKEKTKVLTGTAGNDVLEGNGWGYNYDQSELISTYGGNDIIRAGVGDDVIDAGEGDDTVQGYAGNDTIIGGKGNDFLVGGSGVDTYFFGVGDGQDTINNYDQENWSQDAIVFEDGVLPEDIRISRSGSNMVLTNDRTGDRVTVQNAYNDSRGWNYLGWIEFSDRSMWGMETLKEKTKVLNGTEEADVIEGNPWGYNYDQSEIISTYGGNDVIRAGEGDDSIDAGTGNDTVYGENGNDTIIGETGNDTLMGGYGADTYIFGMGDGQDTINNYDQTNWSEDKIVFLEGILPDDITVTRSGANMVLTNHNSGDKITIQNAYNDSRGWNYLGRIEFSDGTVWGMGELNEKTRILTGTTGNDVINGNEAGYNYNQSEILNGGAGNDTLNGGAGDDIYLFNAHFGCDTINDGNGSNTISFGEGISAEMLDIFRTGNNLEISVTDTTDKVTINNYFTNDNFKNFTYQFFDGDILTGSDIDDIMNGTYLYHSTLQQAELFSDMMSVSETETAGYGNTEAASASMPMGEHEQLWLAS